MRILFTSQRSGLLSAAMIQEADIRVEEDNSVTLTMYDMIDVGGWFEVVGLQGSQGEYMLRNLVVQGYLDLTDYTVSEYDRDELYNEDDDDVDSSESYGVCTEES